MVLEGGEAVLGAAAPVAAPDEILREELPDIVYAMVVQCVDHRLDDATGVLGPAEVGVPREERLFGPLSFHSLTAPALSLERHHQEEQRGRDGECSGLEAAMHTLANNL